MNVSQNPAAAGGIPNHDRLGDGGSPIQDSEQRLAELVLLWISRLPASALMLAASTGVLLFSSDIRLLFFSSAAMEFWGVYFS